MIRIDEIYCNTFLPIIQARPYHGLHWFDPFGSVRFEDICNIPKVEDGHFEKTVRYLFWDQEPLHKENVDRTLTKFVFLYDQGTRHIITSEYNSEMVDYVVSTYDFRSHYYFFHGWAALDWFRGYDRSFVMPEPTDRKIKKTFIMPNRIIGGLRQHRLIMLYHIFRKQMTDNWISCPLVCPAENISISQAVGPLISMYPDIEKVFADQSLPFNFPNEHNHPMHSNRLSLFDQCAESLLYLVTETLAQGRRQHLTEKIFKPICLRMPFVIVGTAGSLEYLRRYGFETFESLWDESYDQEIDDLKRYEKISDLIKSLDTLSQSEKQNLFTQATQICEHNYQHFYSGGLEKILWEEMNQMIKKL